VRTVPRSRYNPQFNHEALQASLKGAGIGYAHAPGLGGFRRPAPDSPNAGWRNLSFRGYADYMQTPAFQSAIDALIARSEVERTAIMCAEAVPWRCHRSLIGDALLVRNVEVLDIMTEKSAKPHTLTSFARVDGHRLWYPPE